MQIGMIGLGKMGANMARRLARGGHKVVGFDTSPDAAASLAKEEPNIKASTSPREMTVMLAPPRAAWLMVPAGDPTEKAIDSLSETMSPGDIIIDGGNSYYKDTVRRAAKVTGKGLHFVDAGTSGGIWGLAEGYSLMLGGEKVAIDRLKPIFETLAPARDRGWGHVGPSGAGHYVKMVHNGIEYGLMQAYAEGFDLMGYKKEFKLDLHQIAEIWRHGSVVRSWLLDLTAKALSENPTLDGVAAYVSDSGEGRWTVIESIELGCAIPVISLALERRFRSRDKAPFADKLLAAMRHQFGGHELKREK